MKLIHQQSLDLRNIGLNNKRKEGIQKIKNNECYSYYIPRANGNIELIEISFKLKQGYSIRTLKPSEYIINR